MSKEEGNKPIEILKFADDSGAYKRQASQFRNTIANLSDARFKPELHRYHLYVSLACPWAHRVLITRVLKGLTSVIGLSVVHWHMDNKGWRFLTEEGSTSCKLLSEMTSGTKDDLYGFNRIRDLYFKADPKFNGRFTVPVLWDKKNETIVNNESSELIRILNTEFNSLLPSEYAELDLYPEHLREDIDAINSWIYDNINNGVYKAGFATKQEVYLDEAYKVFEHLDKVETLLAKNHLANREFLLGNSVTEADIRLYTTIIRFDVVYHQHFKCNLGMIRYDYPHIHKWLRLLYWKIPGFRETTNFDHIKWHYTKSHIAINPNGITPIGPKQNIMPL